MRENICLQKEDKKKLPLGIFDSGVGGLTIVSEIMKFLPRESLIYLGDTARLPYGMKSADTVTRFTREAMDFFLQRQVKMLLIACNTSSCLALPLLKDECDFPVYGVIEPAVEEALKVTRTDKIAVIATRATIESHIYEKELSRRKPQLEVYTCACPLFVPLIEEGWTEDVVTYRVAERYLAKLKKNSIDTLILGCTHYPLMKNVIRQVMGEQVALIDSAAVFAVYIRRELERLDLTTDTGEGGCEFYVTDESARFQELSSLFLKGNINRVSKINLEDYQACIKSP